MGTIAGAMSLYYLMVVKFYDPRALEDTCDKPASIQVRNVDILDCVPYTTSLIFAASSNA